MTPRSLAWYPATLALALAACTGELPPRNTVQHGVIAKEDLVGGDGKAVFYYLQTVVDVPYATGFTFTGEQSLMEKVRWDIQEKVLYARRAYEWVRGSEVGAGEQGSAPGKVVGAPIAAFAIEKHFDIIRDYNTATGEEINKIVENDSDRHWYERKFLRVDWSRNLVPSFEFLVHYDDDAVSPLRQEAVPYYASNPDDPDALRIRRPDATPEVPRPTASYLEVTSKLMVTPEQTTLDFEEEGKFRLPACYLAEDNGPEFASSDCAAQEIKVRHAFLRAGARDYDALVYDDRWMERFGFFSNERQRYDPQYQETESGRVRLANRWNLWRRVLAESSCSLKDHYKAGPDPRAAAEAARRAADAACAALEGEGSSCASDQGRCTLPPEKREGVRPIVYHLSAGFPADLRKAAEESVAAWNDSFGTTVARLLYPKDNPLDSKLLAQRKGELGTLFELRDNDCNQTRVNELLAAHPELKSRVAAAAGLVADPAAPLALSEKALALACSALESATAGLPAGERFEWQRIGDLRYSLIYWVGLPTRAGLLGYGPSSVDPETGEIIQATAFIYGAVHDSYTAKSTDIVGLLNCADEACIQSYAKGVPISDWIALAKSGNPKARTSFSTEEVSAMAKAMSTEWLKVAAQKLPPLDFQSLESLRLSRRARATALASSKLLGQNGQTAASRLKPLQGTALEETAKNQYLAGIGRSSSLLPKLGGAPSLYHLAGPGLLEERRRVRRLLARRKLELASFWDNAILGLALRYKEAAKPRAEIFKDLRARLFKGVVEHEVGHTLGLRHNFAGSYDAMNYSPSYWKLRALAAGGKALPRYKSPLSEAELKGNPKDPAAREGLGSYQYASVMDYGAKFNSDIAGLGYWDHAAIKFGYGQLVEVFEKTAASTEDRYLLANVQTSMRWGEPLLFTVACDGKNYRSVHYTEYPRLLGGVANLGAANRVDVPLRKLTTKKLDKVVPGCAVYADGFGASNVPLDDKGRFEVPYRFCSDEYEGASPECNAFDAGADPYEQAQTSIDSYHAYYLFHNLKLDRLGYSFWGYLDTLSTRYFEPLRSSMQFYTLVRGELTQDPRSGKYLGDTELEAFFKADDGYGPWTVAVDRSLNLLLDVLATPEVGDYWIDLDNRYGTIPYVDTASGKELPPDLTLGIPTAKYSATEWDFDSGYYWYDKMAHVGVYHDKFLALWALTDADTYFMGRDTATDQRQYAINYYRLYPDLITRQVQGLMAEDWAITGHFAVNKAIVKRDFTLAQPPPAGALPVDPQLGFSLQFWGALLGVSLIPATYDTAFLDSCRVWVKGSVEEITPSVTPTCIADPIGGKSYCAMTMKDAAGVQRGIGAGMIARAQTLKDTYTADPTEENRLYLVQYIDSLELMRSITRTFGFTPL